MGTEIETNKFGQGCRQNRQHIENQIRSMDLKILRSGQEINGSPINLLQGGKTKRPPSLQALNFVLIQIPGRIAMK
jgi:hypothetical protein